MQLRFLMENRAGYGIINALRLLSRAVAERNTRFLSARCFMV